MDYAIGYLSRAGWWHRLVVRVFRRHILRVTDWIIGYGYTKGTVDSRRMHDLLGIQNRVLFPEWYARRPPVPGTSPGDDRDPNDATKEE